LESLERGAHVINVSAGQFTPSGEAHPILADAVRVCIESRVLIVASVGNEGCDCLHVPGALPSVLSVGAMDENNEPLEFSNWGKIYQTQGILAPGENIPVAEVGGGVIHATGTSYATALVSGVASLLLSIQLKKGDLPDPLAIRTALLRSAAGCKQQPTTDCQKLLAGRLNAGGAIHIILREGNAMPGPESSGVDSHTSEPLLENRLLPSLPLKQSLRRKTEITLLGVRQFPVYTPLPAVVVARVLSHRS
jgi:cyanobactin maturation PatA/PatG family protease